MPYNEGDPRNKHEGVIVDLRLLEHRLVPASMSERPKELGHYQDNIANPPLLFAPEFYAATLAHDIPLTAAVKIIHQYDPRAYLGLIDVRRHNPILAHQLATGAEGFFVDKSAPEAAIEIANIGVRARRALKLEHGLGTNKLLKELEQTMSGQSFSNRALVTAHGIVGGTLARLRAEKLNENTPSNRRLIAFRQETERRSRNLPPIYWMTTAASVEAATQYPHPIQGQMYAFYPERPGVASDGAIKTDTALYGLLNAEQVEGYQLIAACMRATHPLARAYLNMTYH